MTMSEERGHYTADQEKILYRGMALGHIPRPEETESQWQSRISPEQRRHEALMKRLDGLTQAVERLITQMGPAERPKELEAPWRPLATGPSGPVEV